MKKSLIFAMAMALGVTASAYAANPFSDVPAGHWAYDSIEKLAAAGVIDGYGDGTFGGDKLMTRYEMAQIVARAMANGANVDKLAAEFADELDALGVRVANLEKKADAVKITGQIRTHYASYHSLKNQGTDRQDTVMRSRLWFAGQINDDWTYTGMIQNEQKFESAGGDEDTNFQRAFVNGKLGGVAVEAGRNNLGLLGTGGQVYSNRVDYVKASYGKDVKLTGMIGKMASGNGKNIGGDFWAASLSGKIGVVNAEVTYVDVKDQNPSVTNKVNTRGAFDNSILGIDVKFPIVKNLTLEGLWLKAEEDDLDGNDQGVFAMLKYGGAKANKPGSWGVFAKYWNMAGTTMISEGDDNAYENNFLDAGFTGYGVGAEYAVAKNMIAYIDYVDLESKGSGARDKGDGSALWTHLMITF